MNEMKRNDQEQMGTGKKIYVWAHIESKSFVKKKLLSWIKVIFIVI